VNSFNKDKLGAYVSRETEAQWMEKGVCSSLRIHIVQKGEILANIAEKYGVQFDELQQANPQLSSPDMLLPGMKIKIPGEVKTVRTVSEQKSSEEKIERSVKETMKEHDKDVLKANTADRPLEDAIIPDEKIMSSDILKEKEQQVQPKLRVGKAKETSEKESEQQAVRMQPTAEQKSHSKRKSHGEQTYHTVPYAPYYEPTNQVPYMMQAPPVPYNRCCYCQRPMQYPPYHHGPPLPPWHQHFYY